MESSSQQTIPNFAGSGHGSAAKGLAVSLEVDGNWFGGLQLSFPPPSMLWALLNLVFEGFYLLLHLNKYTTYTSKESVSVYRREQPGYPKLKHSLSSDCHRSATTISRFCGCNGSLTVCWFSEIFWTCILQGIFLLGFLLLLWHHLHIIVYQHVSFSNNTIDLSG